MENHLRNAATFAADTFGRLRRWLTFRRVLGIVGFVIILMCAQQLLMLGMDASFLFGLDFSLIAEVSALMTILSVRDRVMTATYLIRRGWQKLARGGGLVRRSRRSSRTGPVRSLLPPPPEDEPGWAFA